MVVGWFCVAVGSTDTPPRGFLYAACAPQERVITDGRNRRSVCALIMLIN
jgi:hypothetical protein